VLTLDLVNGNPFANAGFVFRGQGGNDQLKVLGRGTIRGNAMYTPNRTTSNWGSIRTVTREMNFEDVESVRLENFTNASFIAPSDATTLSLDMPETGVGRVTNAAGTPQFAPVTV